MGDFPNLSSIAAGRQFSDLSSAVVNISAAFREAGFLAELDLSQDEGTEPEGESVVDSVREQLVEVVPAETLDHLERV